MLAQVESIMKAADHAAEQDFRWWFVALLIIGLLAVWWLFNYFDKDRKELRNECKEARQECEEVRREFTEHLKGANTKLTDTLSGNQEILKLFAETANSVKHLFYK